MKLRASLVSAAVLSVFALCAGAAELGSTAGPLAIGQWIKGGPVAIAPGDKVYVVEFWATWCGPCRMSIPHLTEMQKKYKDKGVVFVGVSDEEADVVKPFVDEMGAKMDYAVALDKDGETNRAYMGAFKRDGIPTAFVVDKQARVVWVGHPMDGLEEVIDGVLDGSYTIEKAKQREARKAQIMEVADRFNGAVNAADKTKLDAVSEELLAKYADEPMMLNQVAWVLLTIETESLRNYPLALKIAKAAVGASKEKDASILDTYARALFVTGDKAGAVSHQQKAVALADDADMKKQMEDTLKAYQQGMLPS